MQRAGARSDALTFHARPAGGTGPVRAHFDVVAAMAAMGLAALATLLPPGMVRLLVTVPVLLVAPGYLMLAAAGVARHGEARLLALGAAVGVGLPLLGLLALSTSMMDGGFRQTPIVMAVLLGSLGLAAVAVVRRRRVATRPAAA